MRAPQQRSTAAIHSSDPQQRSTALPARVAPFLFRPMRASAPQVPRDLGREPRCRGAITRPSLPVACFYFCFIFERVHAARRIARQAIVPTEPGRLGIEPRSTGSRLGDGRRARAQDVTQPPRLATSSLARSGPQEPLVYLQGSCTESMTGSTIDHAASTTS